MTQKRPKKEPLHVFSSVRVNETAAKAIILSARKEKRSDSGQAAHILEQWALQKIKMPKLQDK